MFIKVCVCVCLICPASEPVPVVEGLDAELSFTLPPVLAEERDETSRPRPKQKVLYPSVAHKHLQTSQHTHTQIYRTQDDHRMKEEVWKWIVWDGDV